MNASSNLVPNLSIFKLNQPIKQIDRSGAIIILIFKRTQMKLRDFT